MFNPNEHLMDLKGKAYLQVMWRLVWFREEHPDWAISTNLVEHDKTDLSAIFHAVIKDNNGTPLASGWGSESAKDFKDYLEKAETKAIGRALAMLGYGTQFAPELDEGDRLADSPVPTPAKMETVQDAAAYVLNFGKYSGKTLGEVFKADRDYTQWMYTAEKSDPIVKKAIGMLLAAAIEARANR